MNTCVFVKKWTGLLVAFKSHGLEHNFREKNRRVSRPHTHTHTHTHMGIGDGAVVERRIRDRKSLV